MIDKEQYKILSLGDNQKLSPKLLTKLNFILHLDTWIRYFIDTLIAYDERKTHTQTARIFH